MSRSLSLVTGPTEEPVNVADAKEWAQVDLTPDAVTASLVTAARAWCEAYTRRAFCTQVWRLTLDAFPGSLYGLGGGAYAFPWAAGRYAPPVPDGQPWLQRYGIALPKPPLLAVGSLAYTDSTGALTTLDPAGYQVAGTDPGWLLPPYGGYWPYPRYMVGAVSVTFTCGYGPAAKVPEGVKVAIKLLARHWLENRAAVGRAGLAETPLGLKDLLGPFRTGDYV